MLVFVRPNSSYVRPKLKVIGQMSCQVKYLFAALRKISLFDWNSKKIKIISEESVFEANFHNGSWGSAAWVLYRTIFFSQDS
jgi:hypothetical protein